MPKSEKDKKAGYKKPPKKTQWKKGQSGNPKGRPKKSARRPDENKSFKDIFEEEMRETILINTPEGQKEISTERALIKRLFEKAIKEKDFRSIDKSLQISERLSNRDDADNEENNHINITFATYPDDENSNRTAADYFRDQDLKG